MPAHVLVQTAFLGDLLLSIPLMKHLKSHWPGHRLLLVCRQGLGDFFLQTGLVDEVFEIKKGDGASYRKILAALNAQEIDKVFSPHQSLRTAFFVRQIKAREKIGFRLWWNGVFFKTRIQRDSSLPDALRQLSLLAPFDPELREQFKSIASADLNGAQGPGASLAAVPAWASMDLKPFYKNASGGLKSLLQKLSLTEEAVARSVALFPGSVWATKRWTEEGFLSLGQTLAREGTPVLVMGGPGEEELCSRVAALIPGARNLCGRTRILESALILSRLRAVVGNDSASMHLAATAGTPSVVIFGPTVLAFGYRPWQNHVRVVEKELACRPCGKHGARKCPLGTHECMKRIEASEVVEALRKTDEFTKKV